jgi:cysteine desulfurase / selenocysteine lyase
MTTSDFPEGFPDIAELEKLANQFFKSFPGDASTQSPGLGQFTQQPQGFDMNNSNPLGVGNIPASAAYSGLPPSVTNVLGGVDLPHSQSGIIPPFLAGTGFNPPSLGGTGVPMPALTHADTIDLRDPQSILPDSGSIGSGNVPQSVAGSGISPSAVDQGNAVDLKNPQTSLPDPNNQGLGRIPQSVAGGGKSPSAVEKGNPTDFSGATPNLPGSNSTGLGNVPQSVAGSGISPSAIEQHNAVDLQNPQTSFPDPNNSRQGTSPEPAVKSSGDYSSYLESINVFPGFDGKTPLETGNYFDLPASLLHLPFDSQQPFDKELAEVLKNTPGIPLVPQLPGAVPSASSFYFLNEKNHLQTLVGGSLGAEKEFKDNNGNAFDVNRVKLDFPVLQERVNGKPLIWLDNAATTQKPKQVIDRISYFYEHENSNIHRAAHALAARATDAYEDARKKVQTFLNAGSANEIVFVRGTTEAINLVAKSWGEQFLNPGDEIILTHLEHHANIVPWQQLAAKKGLKIRVIPVDDDGQVILGEYSKLLGPKTKLVSFSQVSNALGTITPAKEIVDMAHQAGAKVLVDGAQSVSHMRTDVRALDADWFVFSGHKIFGPTGIGVLYGKEDLLNETQPWQGGGNMIKDVTFEHTQYHKAPLRFEAGTGNIADAVGLGAALDYVTKLGIDLISQYEHYLLLYATQLLKGVPGLHLIGTAPDKASVLSFVLDGYSTEQVGSALNQEGIAVRSGHHCAQPILRRFGLEATVRPSLAFYNTCADVDVLIATLYRLVGSRSKK